MAKTRKRHYWWRTLVVLALLGGLLAGGLAWLASSETAFAWALVRLETISRGKLKIAGVHGALFGPITIDRIEFADESLQLGASDVRLTWFPWALMGDHLAIGMTSARQVSLRLLPSDGQASIPASVALPLRVSVERAAVTEMEIVSGDSRLALRDIALGYEGDLRAHRVRSLRVASDWGALEATGELDSRDPFALSASAILRRAPERVAKLALSGTLRRIDAKAEADFDDIRAQADALLKPFDPLWLEKLEVRAQGIDLARLVKDAPASDVTLLVNAASRDAESVAGTLQASNANAGTLGEGRFPARQVRSDFVTDLRSARLESLEIRMSGGGRFSGSGELTDRGATFALGAHAINLRGIYAGLLATELDGRVDASLTESGETVRAQLAQGPLAIRLDVARRGSELEVRDARVTARGGRVQTSGRLVMDGDMPMTAKATFAGFDPSEWGSYPAATVNGKLTLRGALARRSGELSFRLTQSRFRGAGVTGQGTARMTDERIESADMALDVGANRISVRGAFGAPGDALALTVAAPRIAQLDPRIEGRVDASAKAGGTWQAPRVSFTASGVDLRVQRALAIGRLGASGEIGWAPGSPLQIDAEATNVTARGLAADQITLHTKGTPAQHAIEVKAIGKTVDFAAKLVGGWRAGRGWTGTLAALENRGALPISLDSAAPLDVSPERVVAGATTLRVGGGRVALGETRVAPGNFTTSGEFDALPAALLVALAGAGDLVESSLLVGGNWRLAATPRLNGTLRIKRESGDLVFRTEPRLALGLSTFELDAGLVDERATARLAAQGSEFLLDVQGEARPIGTGAEAGLARASPISLSARLDVPSLAPFAVLFRTRANFDGRVRADITATGTLGKPVWQGRLDASRIRILSPPLGIDWHDGLLRAEISENAVRVSELSIAGGQGRLTGDGLVTQSGDEATGRLSWRAERFAALNRPDRNLTLSGSGTAVAEARRLTLRGSLRADSGHFEFDPSGTLELGDDVVVAGRAPKRESGAATERRLPVLLAFDLDMGENLTIRGAGLDAKLGGRLNVRSLSTGQVLGDGVIETRRGVFRAYGQRLDIERGRLIFDGPIENPAVDIVAWRRNQAVEAGVEVKGSLRAPLIRVVSNPPVPESEQLAWLVLGRPAEAGTQADYAALQVAAAALIGAAGGGSQESFANRVGLDEIGMVQDSGGGQAVTLGKRLSDRIYVSYEQSISAALAVLRLELALTRRFSARAETGTRSGMDLFYRYSFD
ncbi:MAG: translocation/assembly module TamB domain-containing protein [Betaproteobacteria bacterium]|nr:translocation/assembly module TamB domain-containing protein [Betaproteobacteria bacterium]MDH3437298.1 translocation/assembly module TamB domain-containing protein [Betaproteobacteria bacterium]